MVTSQQLNSSLLFMLVFISFVIKALNQRIRKEIVSIVETKN